MHTFLDKRMDM